MLDLYLFFKIVILIVVFIYFVFTIVVLNQMRTMDKIAHYPVEGFIKFLSIIHALFALSLFLIGFAIL